MFGDLLRRVLFSRTARRRWARSLAVLTPAVLAFAFWPKGSPATLGGWDKADHAGAFALLAICGYFAWRTRRRMIWSLGAALLLLGAAIEVVQIWVPGRQSSLLDLLADAVGIGLGLALAALTARAADRRRSARSDDA